MTPLEQQLEILKGTPGYEHARLETSGGTTVVVLPDVALIAGWKRQSTTIRFVLPPGYPFGRPDCFYADADLRLADGRVPQAAQVQPLPGAGTPLLWFSWHPQGWNPNRDSLVTYARVIRQRLGEIR